MSASVLSMPPGKCNTVEQMFGQAEAEDDALLAVTDIDPTLQPEAVMRVWKSAEKRWSGLLWGVGLLNLVFTAALAFYYATVFLNFTFTFANLAESDIAFYTTSPSTPSDRFGTMWWLIALTALRIVIPLCTTGALAHAIVYRATTVLTLAQIWIFFHAVLELVLTGAFLINLYGVNTCEDVNVCRNWNPLGDPNEANWLFVFLAWFAFATFLVLVIFFFILGSAIGRTLDWAWWFENKEYETSKIE
jgi:hypothetical protein